MEMLNKPNPVERDSIRRLYYISNISLVVVLSLSLLIPFLLNIRKEYANKSHQLSESIIRQKEEHLKALVEEKISDITMLQENMQRVFSLQAALWADYLWELQPDVEKLGTLDTDPFSLSFFPENSRKPGGEPDLIERYEEDPSAFPVWQMRGVEEGRSVVVYLTEEEFTEILQERIKDLIRSTRLPDNGYFWVNKILNYDGGKDYALRLVHPNLPETEGMLLSTDTEDDHGNRPYLQELKGIREKGYVFYEYYFKKMDSDAVSHKLSYAELYRPYDWVIATGVYLDDVDALVQSEKQAMKKSMNKNIRSACIIFVLMLGMAFVVIWQFERKISSMIQHYTMQLSDMNHRLEELAFLDSLTSLWNRRGMFSRLREQMSLADRTEQPFCLAMADIDFFKKINDSYGHDAGDRVLTVLAEMFQTHLRKEDSIARWGGEEFLLLLHTPDKEQAYQICEKIRRIIEEAEVDYKGEILKITMTFGISVYHPGNKLDATLEEADANLYKGKKASRNCVVIS